MKKSISPALSRTINRQAHMLALQSFAAIRMKLEEKASTLLREGQSLDETLRAIRAAGVRHGTPEP
ncbi:MAG: hypothetical protein ACYCZ6_06330 [Polaromonas sp.]